MLILRRGGKIQLTLTRWGEDSPGEVLRCTRWAQRREGAGVGRVPGTIEALRKKWYISSLWLSRVTTDLVACNRNLKLVSWATIKVSAGQC